MGGVVLDCMHEQLSLRGMLLREAARQTAASRFGPVAWVRAGWGCRPSRAGARGGMPARGAPARRAGPGSRGSFAPMQWLVRFRDHVFLNERAILGAILANAMLLFVVSFQEVPDLRGLGALDYGFTSFFLLEALAKIQVMGLRGYLASNWNRFDFLLVLASLPSFLLLFMDIPDLSFLLVLRLARVARFFRFIRFIPNIEHLLAGVRRALRVSSLVLVAFFLYNCTLALISCHLFRDLAPEHFGNPLLALYSTFKIFTIEGWFEVPDRLAQELSAGAALGVRLYFVACVVTGGLFGLSIINAIFVDEMTSDNNDDISLEIDALHAKLDRLLAAQVQAATSSAQQPDAHGPEPAWKATAQDTDGSPSAAGHMRNAKGG